MPKVYKILLLFFQVHLDQVIQLWIVTILEWYQVMLNHYRR